MSTYIKEIQATPTLSGKDAIDIVRQVLRTHSPESIDKKKKMLEARKRIEKKCVWEEIFLIPKSDEWFRDCFIYERFISILSNIIFLQPWMNGDFGTIPYTPGSK